MDPLAAAQPPVPTGLPGIPQGGQPGANPDIWNPNNVAQLLADLQMKGIGPINQDLLNLYMQLFGLGGQTPIGYGQSRPVTGAPDPVMLLQQQDALRQQLSDRLSQIEGQPIGGPGGGGQLSPATIAQLGAKGGVNIAKLLADPSSMGAAGQTVGTGSAGTNPALAAQRAGERAPIPSGGMIPQLIGNPFYTPGVTPAPPPPLPPGMPPLTGSAPSAGGPGIGPSPTDVFGGISGGDAGGLVPGEGAGMGGLSQGLGIAGAGIGEAGALFNLFQAVKSGDPLQIAAAVAQAGVAGVALAQSIAPEMMAAIMPAMTALEATGYGAAIASAVMSTLSFAEDISHHAKGGIGRAILDAGAGGIPIVGSTFQDMISKAFGPSHAYQTFPTRAAETVGFEASDLAGLAKALPYVQNQDQLRQLIGAFKSDIGNAVGGYGQGSGDLQIPGLPALTGTEHGTKGQGFDPSQGIPDIQQVVDMLSGKLPAGGGQNPSWFNLFGQFRDPQKWAPVELPSDVSTTRTFETGGGEGSTLNTATDVTKAGLYGRLPGSENFYGNTPLPLDDFLKYGDTGYNYAEAGWPTPDQPFGNVSDTWTQLMAAMGMGGQTPQGPPQPGGMNPIGYGISVPMKA